LELHAKNISRQRMPANSDDLRATNEQIRRKEDRVERNFDVRNWRRYIGRLNREVEGSEDPWARMEKKVQVRPHLARSRMTAHRSSLLPFVSSSLPLPRSLRFFFCLLPSAFPSHFMYALAREHARGACVHALPTNARAGI